MEKNEVIKSIGKRSGGDIYLGIVGAVRTGKSTFIRKFMENLVIPNIEDEYERKRCLDELPQAAAGKTIMTTEPKFVPATATKIMVEDFPVNIRMIDCVGYIIPEAKGYEDENGPRLVMTPWYQEPIPFIEAAEIGTEKVIKDHSTIGIVVTTDGSIGDIPRKEYEEAEKKVVEELASIGKPYIIILNSTHPMLPDTEHLADKLKEEYKVPVLPINIEAMSERDMYNILKDALYEFPIEQINISLPRWVDVLDDEHWLKKNLYTEIKTAFKDIRILKQIDSGINNIKETDVISRTNLNEINLGTGNVNVEIQLPDDLFYKILTETTGVEVRNEGDLFAIISELSSTKKEYDKISYALNEVKQKGYGIVTPSMDDLILEEPEMVKQGSRFGVKLKAKAPSIHMIRADIETEVSPIVGSERQSEELVNYLLSEFENDPKKIWESNIFGKNLHELVNEGLQNKLYRMPEDAQGKIQETLERIINEGSGGLICIIL